MNFAGPELFCRRQLDTNHAAIRAARRNTKAIRADRNTGCHIRKRGQHPSPAARSDTDHSGFAVLAGDASCDNKLICIQPLNGTDAFWQTSSALYQCAGSTVPNQDLTVAAGCNRVSIRAERHCRKRGRSRIRCRRSWVTARTH